MHSNVPYNKSPLVGTAGTRCRCPDSILPSAAGCGESGSTVERSVLAGWTAPPTEVARAKSVYSPSRAPPHRYSHKVPAIPGAGPPTLTGPRLPHLGRHPVDTFDAVRWRPSPAQAIRRRGSCPCPQHFHLLRPDISDFESQLADHHRPVFFPPVQVRPLHRVLGALVSSRERSIEHGPIREST